MLISMKVAKEVAEDFIFDLIRSEMEDPDSGAEFKSSGPGDCRELARHIMKKDGERVMYLFGQIIGQITEAWGHDAGLVLHHMGVLADDDEAVKVLYRLVMGCSGHGIGIDDDHGEEFQKASDTLTTIGDRKGTPLESHPMDFDADCLFNDVLGDFLLYPEDDDK